MFKKITSILTATVLVIGISTIAAPTANAFASNSGAASKEIEIRITIDSSGFFTIPANTTRVQVSKSILLNSQNAATFSSHAFSATSELKDPNGNVITNADINAITPNSDFYKSVYWSATGVSGYTIDQLL